MHEGGIVRVGMTSLDDVDCMAFEIDGIFAKSFDEPWRWFLKLTWERSFPPSGVVFGSAEPCAQLWLWLHTL